MTKQRHALNREIKRVKENYYKDFIVTAKATSVRSGKLLANWPT